ncbi:MAG TPA: neuraminidase-like domain-containing protein [Candidatus Dormibacteraeota bacterium]|nr:neuraminidase-like domain-containing protein [Candidatus Dormibacteraeota bacterium]
MNEIGSTLSSAVIQPGTTFVVAGRVFSSQRSGVGGLGIEVVDKNVGADVSLAQGITDASGNYSAQFPSAEVARHGKTAPDIQVRVLSGQTLLAASEVRYNASSNEKIDVVLPAAAAASLPSEHETLTSALSLHFKGNLRDLKETDQQQDITFLANKTGWDARAVALAALADQFSQTSRGTPAPVPTTKVAAAAVAVPHIQPEFFYALFRAGLPANPDTLYQANQQTVVNTWKQAIAQGVIPKSLENQIPQAQHAFQTLSAQKLLTGQAPVGVSRLKDMLAVSRLTEAQQQNFASLYAANRTDLSAFWKSVANSFGQDVANRIQLNGKLAFLTINNASLMQQLQQKVGGNAGLSDPAQLAQAGFHRAAKWQQILSANVPVPAEIPGDATTKKANYAAYLAAHVRLSYPTASIAEMVNAGDFKVNASEQVSKFLNDHQGKFEIGVQPVQQYIAKNKLKIDGGVVEEVKKLQRVNQMTQSDQAMQALLKNDAHSAYQIVRMDKQAFVQKLSADIGGADEAARVYDKAVHTHHAVMNVAVSYITARSGFQLGANPLPDGQPNLVLNNALVKTNRNGNNGQVLQPAPTGPTPQNADDVIAYPTLEKLFGSMDFCTCSDCRSVLSPAAYLVDLLDFIDHEPSAVEKAAGKLNPQSILLDRRPDLQHLPLTCENTNTALPYIDVVNETLEYYVANQAKALSLQEYKGHDTGDSASADLLASPQFVMDSAYTLLRGERFPSQLPFHQPLEKLRRYFDKFEVPLPLAMERLRKSDDLERGGNPYGWRDILAQGLRLSRDEYDLLTNGTLTLKQIYGFAPAKTDAQVSDELSNAKKFSRRAEISYQDVVSLLTARFINPNSDLIPKLSKLGVNIAMLVELKTKNNAATDKKFDDLLPQGAAAPDPAEYGGDIKKWVKDPNNFNRIMGLITLTDPASSPDPCNFGNLEFRFAKPMADANDKSTRLGTPEFVRMLRFIRLRKKTGWTIEQTDAAICSLYRADLKPVTAGDLDAVAKLDAGFKVLLPRLGIISRVMRLLNLSTKRDLLPLLACWSDISTHGDNALYRQMFLNPAVSQHDPDFADNGFGEFLVNNKKLLDHAETLRAAFSLTGDEFDRIVAALGFDANTLLTLPNISAIYRRGWLAHKMRLSVRELLLLISLTGLDPFAAPDSPSAGNPAIVHLITLVQAMKARSLKSAAALYLIWNQDLSGKSAPTPAQVTEFARKLRGDFAAIEDQFAATEDPGGDIARARMTLVYGQEASDAFFALLNNTIVLDVSYTHPTPALEPAITAVDANLAYDSFRHRLSHTGLLSAVTQGNLTAVLGVPNPFKDAIDKLFALSQDASGSFFARYPELKPLYDSYIASADPIEVKRSKLLAAFRPALSRLRKQQQALQRLSAAAVVDLPSTQALVNASAAPFPLHAGGDKTHPALNDVLAVETPGLAAQFFFRDTATGAVDKSDPAAANLDYAPVTNPLPANPVSGIWTGSVEAPDSGFYNIIVETDAGAAVSLTLDGKVRPLVQNGTLWRNNDSIELNGGKLYDIALKVENAKQNLSVKWENPKRSREVIPGRYLYPPTVIAPFRDVYIRFLKATSLATTLLISADELVRFANDADYQVNADGWLNALPVSGDPIPATAAALLRPLEALLAFAEIKAAVSPSDNQLLTVLLDPASATANPDSLMFSLLRWDKASLTALLSHFGAAIGDLTHFDTFRKIYGAFALVQTMGISAAALTKATTNDPDGNLVRDFQSALRARYDAASWRDIIQPINNDMRGLQRDALVAYILHQFRENPATDQIDTPDKLFEYFLMDVEMEPCMQTSRIRHALSTAQLFIERCLMNLEPHATLSSTQAKRWEWMKRYRVWEANRKVFIYPENWLEPELRDDKSPFFKEIESELLQSDITDERASIALLNYLAKLEEVAKLEICGIHYIPADPASLTDEFAHVVARTSGAHRKYYYRRLEFGYWTAWDQIKLDIEDNPVIPVVWNDRLFIFWLKIMQRSPQKTQRPPAGKLIDLTAANLPSDPQITVQAALCWSEYYNGKWQAARTSDVNNPITIDTFAAGAFDRTQLKLSALFWTQGSLRLIVSYGSGSGVSFFLHNAFSTPELRAGKKEPHFSPPRTLETSTSTLRITYSGSSLSSNVVNDSIADRCIQPNHPVAGNAWDPPFFYEDARHVFYVTTSEQLVLVPTWNDIGAFLPPAKSSFDIPSLVLPTVNIIPDPIGPIAKQPGFGVNDPSPAQRYITQDAYIHQAIGTLGTVRYGDTEIGVAGSQVKTIRNR